LMAEPDTGIITNTTLTPAAGPDNSDAAVGIDMLLNEHDQPAGQEQAGQEPAGQEPAGQEPAGQEPAGQEPAGQEPAGQEQAGQGGRWEVLADSACGTGEALVALHDAGHTPIITPWTLRPAVEGGFSIDDFPVIEPTNDQPGFAACPNGVTRPITPTRNVTFGTACR